jgi:hypothetical protein
MNRLLRGPTDEDSVVVEIRSSWIVHHGEVRPLGVDLPMTRERQRSRIRERILATGQTSRDRLDETRRILRERIARGRR